LMGREGWYGGSRGLLCERDGERGRGVGGWREGGGGGGGGGGGVKLPEVGGREGKSVFFTLLNKVFFDQCLYGRI